jgi:hypothetical protein
MLTFTDSAEFPRYAFNSHYSEGTGSKDGELLFMHASQIVQFGSLGSGSRYTAFLRTIGFGRCKQFPINLLSHFDFDV